MFQQKQKTVYWDDQLLLALSRGVTDERFAILITSKEVDQSLGEPKIDSDTGKNQAKAVFETLLDWSVLKNIEALCCDSTSNNTGYKKGACAILELLCEKDFLCLICRHHTYECFEAREALIRDAPAAFLHCF